jgi:hypothetical protein
MHFLDESSEQKDWQQCDDKNADQVLVSCALIGTGSFNNSISNPFLLPRYGAGIRKYFSEKVK